MRKAAVGYAIGKLMQVLGLALVAPLAIAVHDHRALPSQGLLSNPEVLGFAVSVLLSLLFGSILVLVFRGGRDRQGIREGYAVVALGWIIMTFWSCVPLWLYLYMHGDAGTFSSFTDAYFEIMSGYTTTGATILTNIEAIPRSLLLLRALTHWLGGMGIITLAIVIFPSMGVTAYQMFRGEVPGPSKHDQRLRLTETVMVLWGVYALLTAAETLLLWAGGMNLFESVCHSFATMATGGFSTRNASVEAFNSDFIEWVIIFFMFLAGANFLLQYKALRGDLRSMFGNSEFRLYSAVIGIAIVLTTSVLFVRGLDTIEATSTHFRHDPMTTEEFDHHYFSEQETINSLYGSFKDATFQTVSIVTTTGFCTADFDLWPSSLRLLLLLLMFFGGCAGSTGGGMKMVRVMVVLKVAWTALRRMTQPRLVAPVKLDRQALTDDNVVNVVAFVILFVVLFVITSLLMTLFVPDFTTAIASSIATIGNIGPGLAGVGAIENYSWIPIPGKWILILSMLLGRLEIFTVLIAFRPSVWRK